MKNLPIYAILEQIKSTLQNESTLILQASAGAGKSTVVPIALLEQPWLNKNATPQTIIMLEPRRVAARMVATQMAKLLGEKVGERIGYQVKMESCFSSKTKLLVVTEAILVRKLQSDQALENVAMVIFDEFHERSIHTDLSLALSLQVQELLRPDLKLLIMSATLNSNALLNVLGNVPVITSHGRAYEVENIYLPANIKQPDSKSMNSVLLNITLKALKEDQGDILIFLPGVKEINKLQIGIEENLEDNSIEVLPLYSSLTKDKQDKALLPSPKRKVILSTNIAQTSVTIEGVKVVIDSGLEKLSVYNNANAMNHLNLSFISQDSAIQRSGRAGRLSAGKCYRLWHKGKILQQSTAPEILRADLSSFFLDIALWGEDIQSLPFLDYPSLPIQNSTKTVLQELQMLDAKHNITSFGKKALALGVHPRFAFMILKANALGFAYEACLLCAMLTEKDILKNSYANCDIYTRFIHLYEKDFDTTYINTYRAKNIITQAQYFYSKLKAIETCLKNNDKITQEYLGLLLLFAYPDRLAKKRDENSQRYKLSNGKGAMLSLEDGLFNEAFLVVPSLNAHNKDSYINLALKISLNTIQQHCKEHIQIADTLSFNKQSKKFDIKAKHTFYELELFCQAKSLSSDHDFSMLFCDLIKKEGLSLLSWSKKAKDLQQRVEFIATNSLEIDVPDFSNEALLNTVQSWLKPYLQEVKTIKQLETLDMYAILMANIPWQLQQQIDILSPSHIKVPSGSNIKIDYSNKRTPVLAVKIQEMFGLNETPKILNNTFAVQIHLLSPALRPIQITYDLKSFWDNSYAEVKKELFSKYKKHYWPDNPYEAQATNKTKKNMKQ